MTLVDLAKWLWNESRDDDDLDPLLSWEELDPAERAAFRERARVAKYELEKRGVVK
jgi:hypothetical protein